MTRRRRRDMRAFAHELLPYPIQVSKGRVWCGPACIYVGVVR